MNTTDSTATTDRVIDYGIFKVLDISRNPDAMKRERARHRNRTLAEFPAPGWYDKEMLVKAKAW